MQSAAEDGAFLANTAERLLAVLSLLLAVASLYTNVRDILEKGGTERLVQRGTKEQLMTELDTAPCQDSLPRAL